MSHRKEIENDIWFANQVEALRQMTPPHEVDVTDAVMKSIAHLQPLAPTRTKRSSKSIKITSSVAAICAAIILVFILLPSQKTEMSRSSSPTLSTLIDEIYGFCMNNDSGDDAVFLDNPVINFI